MLKRHFYKQFGSAMVHSKLASTDEGSKLYSGSLLRRTVVVRGSPRHSSQPGQAGPELLGRSIRLHIQYMDIIDTADRREKAEE